MEIRRELDQVSPDDYDSRLKRYFPQLNHPQLSLNIDDQVESLSLLDPLVFYFSIDDSSSHPNDMLQEVMKINLSDRLSVISSTRKTPLLLPMSRQVRCLYTASSMSGNHPRAWYRSLQALIELQPRVTHQWGEISYIADGEQVNFKSGLCLELSLRAQIVSSTATQVLRDWVKTEETKLDASLMNMIFSIMP